MKDAVVTLVGIFVFTGLLVVAIWFSAALMIFVFLSSLAIAGYVMLRGYYENWKQHNSHPQPPENVHKVTETKIIDVEYTEISDKDN